MNPTLNIFFLLLCLYHTNLVKMERTIQAVAGSDITLSCLLNGSYKLPEWLGPPNYTIYLLSGDTKLNDQVPSVSQNRLRISENNVDLILSHVHKSDSGPYQCQYQDLGFDRFMLVVKDSDELQSHGEILLIVLIAVGATWIGICACVVIMLRCCGCRYAILKLDKHHNRPWPYWKVLLLFFVSCCFVGWVYIIVKLIQTRPQGTTRDKPGRAVKGTNAPLLDTTSAEQPTRKKSFMVRQSKFRHVSGQALKKEQCYDNIRVTQNTVDSLFCSVNQKYLAVITETMGGGAFMVLPLSRTGRLNKDPPLISGHTAPVLDIKFCPHNDDVIASCSDDCTVKVWQIPGNGLFSNLQPDKDLRKHEKRVNFIEWHPTALNLLLSSGSDNKIFMWNCGEGVVVLTVDMPDLCLSCSFNYDGSKFATTCKDSNIRVFDARSGKMLKEGKGHEGVKSSKCAYLKEDKIFTTGFTKNGERQYALWDAKNLDTPMNMQGIDREHGVIFPLYDPDISIVWLCGKGDGIIRYYEITDEAPYVHFLSDYQSNQPQRGIGMMPKRGLNVNICEIARFYRLQNTGLCEVIQFIVPRKSDVYHEDLYPDTASGKATLSAEEFMKEKKSSAPKMMSLRNNYLPSKKENSSSSGKPNALNTPRNKPADTGEGAAEVTSQSQSDSQHFSSTKVPSKIHASLNDPAKSEA